ncbi:MarR family transcriptional regulator [uncultured Vagococcus sp.]|uniref:MarR family winged helix-turn-helix transcriptional regulator n=1 Tax=uncultured Vagococcus sp. TaxID=189676 RepID=UPI0028D22A2B|nr:MarR family transcriptional regulator [uncultured Vagococcus sp.]
MNEKLTRDILLSLRELRKETQALLEEQSKTYNISTTQLFILDMLDKHPQASLHEVAKMVNLSASTTSAVVEKMVQAGYLKREQSQKSRRTLELSLTDSGKETLTNTYSGYIQDFAVLGKIEESRLLAFYETQQDIIHLLKQRRLASGEK